jgi:cytidylate kinase
MGNLKDRLSSVPGKVIAIDGPAGAGKSTTAKLVAERLGYRYLDTGAMYRVLTFFALKNGIPPSDSARLAEAARRMQIEFENHDGINRVLMNGTDVTAEIRTPEVTRHVSEVSAHKNVRHVMVDKQRELGKAGSIVAEGRDITTVVFPDADVKVYLDASLTERAQRRLLDLAKMDINSSLGEQEADLKRRDEYDSKRAHSPLTKAQGAIVVDTTHLTIEQQVDRIVAIVLSTAEHA